eukprot:511331_1
MPISIQTQEISPLLQKTRTNQCKATCKFVTLLLFALIVIGLGAYSYLPHLPSSMEFESRARAPAAQSHPKMQLTYETKGTYKGAVLEYNSVYHKTYYWSKKGELLAKDFLTNSEDAKTFQTQNIERIAPYVQQASDEEVDILVLSEFALNGLVPTREEMFLYLEIVPDPEGDECRADANACTPCNNNDFAGRTTLQQLSCLAADNDINLVVNYGDYRDCAVGVDEACEDGHYQWNTMIVFDYEGVIISKYKKIHTYKEDEYDVPLEEDPTRFTITLPSDKITEVTFGILICYDSMYASPLLPLIKDGVTDFVMSHWWVNSGPVMNIDMWLQALSNTYGINLLFAANTWVNEGSAENTLTGAYYLRGYNARDSSGSGLYSKGAVISDWYNQNNVEKVGVLVSGVMPIGITSNAYALPYMPDYIEGNIADVQGAGKFYEKSQILGEVKKSKRDEMDFEGTLELDSGFKCTVSATVKLLKPSGGDTRKNWIWMYAFDGYFQTPDGGNIWYYENVCVIGVCDWNCYNYGTQGDTTHVQFSAISVKANFDDDATMFVMSGDDAAKPVGKVEVDGKEVDFYETSTLAGGDTMIAKREGTDDKVLLNLSVLGRVFSKDVKVIAD